MTSLALAAHTTPAAPPFNATFYATAATIIPVFFLAIAVQGNMYKNMITAARAKISATNSPRFRTTLAALGTVWLLLIGTQLILAAGVLGEALAVNALAYSASGHLTPNLVRLSILLLTVAVAIGPGIQLAQAILDIPTTGRRRPHVDARAPSR
jgi:hypothetical protein